MALDSKNRKKLIIFGVIILATIILVRVTGLHDKISLENAAAELGYLTELAHKPYGPPLYIASIIAFVIFHLPVMLMVILGGLVYNFWEALLYSWVGCVLGFGTTFLVSKYFLQDTFKPRLERSIFKKYIAKLERDGIFTMILLRLLLFMAAPLNWIIGATAIKFKDYIIGGAIGIMPMLLAICLTIKEAQSIKTMRDALRPEIFGIVGAFVVLFIIVALVRKKYFMPPELSTDSGDGEAGSEVGETESL